MTQDKIKAEFTQEEAREVETALELLHKYRREHNQSTNNVEDAQDSLMDARQTVSDLVEGGA